MSLPLDLGPRFTFAQFKRANPIAPDTLWELIYARNADTITVKRLPLAVENLRSIIEATFRLANQVGFGAMTLRDLCKETGLSMGGLYGYLQSKDALAAMVADVIRMFSVEFPRWFEDESLPPIVRLDSTLRAHIFMSELLLPWFYFVFMESRVLEADQRKVARASEMDFQKALARRILDVREMGGRQAFLLAAHLQSLNQDWFVKRWKYRAEKISVDDYANSISAMVETLLEGSVKGVATSAQ